jgi:hypothetical protein
MLYGVTSGDIEQIAKKVVLPPPPPPPHQKILDQ